jgi:hypothetical protein
MFFSSVRGSPAGFSSRSRFSLNDLSISSYGALKRRKERLSLLYEQWNLTIEMDQNAEV